MAHLDPSRVVATDAVPHCVARMDAIKQYYDVEFEFSAVGLLYDLDKKLSPQCFDFINFSLRLHQLLRRALPRLFTADGAGEHPLTVAPRRPDGRIDEHLL